MLRSGSTIPVTVEGVVPMSSVETREGQQDSLILTIVLTLEVATRKEGKSEVDKFADLAICIIYYLFRRHTISHDFDKDRLFSRYVEPPITAFITDAAGTIDDIERRYLLARLLDRIQALATEDIHDAYQDRTFVAA